MVMCFTEHMLGNKYGEQSISTVADVFYQRTSHTPEKGEAKSCSFQYVFNGRS